jgi:hypothetical protein
MVSIALSSRGRGKNVCWICIWVSCLYYWRRRIAWFAEVGHESIEAEVIQQVELHEGKVCGMNLCALLQPFRPTSVG